MKTIILTFLFLTINNFFISSTYAQVLANCPIDSDFAEGYKIKSLYIHSKNDCNFVPEMSSYIYNFSKELDLDVSNLSVILESNNTGDHYGEYHPLGSLMTIQADSSDRPESIMESTYHELGHFFDYNQNELKTIIDNCKKGALLESNKTESEYLESLIFLDPEAPSADTVSDFYIPCFEEKVNNLIDAIHSELMADIVEATFKESASIIAFGHDFYKDNRSFHTSTDSMQAMKLYERGDFQAGADNYLATLPFRQHIGKVIDFKKVKAKKDFLVGVRQLIFDSKVNFKDTLSKENVEKFKSLEDKYSYWRKIGVASTFKYTHEEGLKITYWNIQKLNESLIEKSEMFLSNFCKKNMSSCKNTNK